MGYDFSDDGDDYLFHLVGEAPGPDDGGHLDDGLEALEPEPPPKPDVPVLLRLRRVDWAYGGPPGFTKTSQIGDVVAALVGPRALAALERDPDVTLEVSREVEEPDVDVSPASGQPVDVCVPALGETGSRAVVGIIDMGFDVLHRAFRDEHDMTRIIALWDQRHDAGAAQPGVSYGTVHTQEIIDGYIAAGAVPADLGRDIADDPPVGKGGHGTHVASIAAGRAAGEFRGGLAPDARLVLVIPKLTAPEGDVRSIGYSNGHVDALAFIDRQAGGAPVVVNVSAGMNAGAHDGTSTLEAAFDNFTLGGRRPGRVIVKSAGNAGEEQRHAQCAVRSKLPTTLRWQSEGIAKEDLIELWFRCGDRLEMMLIAPNGERSPAVSADSRTVNHQYANKCVVRMTYKRFHRDNGDSRVLVTVRRGAIGSNTAGNWRLEMRCEDVRAGGRVFAWVETQRLHFEKHERNFTLSVPGTARSVITVAAAARPQSADVASFSSHGPTRDDQKKPDIAAPGVGIRAARGGTENGAVAMSGTSMAAPQVTGAVALVLSQLYGDGAVKVHELPNASQIRAALIAHASGFNEWDKGLGWGLLDAEALLGAFR